VAKLTNLHYTALATLKSSALFDAADDRRHQLPIKTIPT
jgi:hypothetical protein